MAGDKRRSPRRDIRHVAVVFKDDSTRVSCTLSDISATGARLELDDPAELPDEFVLYLSGNGRARRRCKVVRRAAKHVGVMFVAASPRA
jgi:PilZ domain